METVENMPITIESVLSLIKEMALSFDRGMAESKQQSKENERMLTEKLAETDMLLKETIVAADKRNIEADKRSAETDRQIKELKEMIGGVSNSNGMAAEEFFINTIERGNRNIFGEHFTDCFSLVRRYNKEKKLRSEQDIILVNGEAVALVEVKYKAQRADIQKIINRLPSFRALHPEYKTHRIYLGLAAMAFDNGVERESEKEGIAIVKQVGNTFVINDENMTVF